MRLILMIYAFTDNASFPGQNCVWYQLLAQIINTLRTQIIDDIVLTK